MARRKREAAKALEEMQETGAMSSPCVFADVAHTWLYISSKRSPHSQCFSSVSCGCC